MTNNIASAPEHLLHAYRPQPRRPARPGNRTRVQDGPVQVRVHSPRVDPEVRNLVVALHGERWKGGSGTVGDADG